MKTNSIHLSEPNNNNSNEKVTTLFSDEELAELFNDSIIHEAPQYVLRTETMEELLAQGLREENSKSNMPTQGVHNLFHKPHKMKDQLLNADSMVWKEKVRNMHRYLDELVEKKANRTKERKRIYGIA